MALTAVGCGLLLVGFVVPGWVSLAAVGGGLLPAALALLGLASGWREMGSGARGVVLAVLAAVALGPWWVYRAAVRWPAEGGVWWLGLPMPTALLVFGVGLVSLVITGLVHAWTFRAPDPSADP